MNCIEKFEKINDKNKKFINFGMYFFGFLNFGLVFVFLLTYNIGCLFLIVFSLIFSVYLLNEIKNREIIGCLVSVGKNLSDIKERQDILINKKGGKKK